MRGAVRKLPVVAGRHIAERGFASPAQDVLAVVNPSDAVIGSATKDEAHKVKNHADPADAANLNTCYSLPLHRAFSVLLFNETASSMLLQRRAASKPTFAGCWANACCSHQLLNAPGTSEIDAPEDLQAGHAPGSAHAAQRKMQQELGATPTHMRMLGLHFAGRILYRAPDVHDPLRGEAELDHIFVATLPQQVIDSLVPNSDEIEAVWQVDEAEFNRLAEQQNSLMAPWLRHLHVYGLLSHWWYLLRANPQGSALQQYSKDVIKFADA